MSLQTQIADHVKRVKARRWLDYSRIFARSSQDCMADAVVAMIVVANEHHLREHGRQDLDRFLEMGLDDLDAYLNEVLGDDDEAAPEGADFHDSPADGGPVAGGLVAD